MCQCNQIGGPFIAEDPDCPVHGVEAQARARQFQEYERHDVTFTDQGIQLETEYEGTILIPHHVILQYINRT